MISPGSSENGISVATDGAVTYDLSQITGLDPTPITTSCNDDERAIEQYACDTLLCLLPHPVTLDPKMTQWILTNSNRIIKMINATAGGSLVKGSKLKPITYLHSDTIARLIVATGLTARVGAAGSGALELCVRVTDPASDYCHTWQRVPMDPTKSKSPTAYLLYDMARVLADSDRISITKIYAAVVSSSPRRTIISANEHERWLVPMRDGIRDLTHAPFTPGAFIPWDDPAADAYTFDYVLQADYHPEIKDYPEPHITTKAGVNWSPSYQMAFTFCKDVTAPTADEMDKTAGGWFSLRYALTPRVPYGRMIMYLNSSNFSHGNNGKSTLLDIIRTLYSIDGNSTFTPAIPLSNKDTSDFLYSQLADAKCVLVDEVQTDKQIKGCITLKAIATHDAINVNKKFEAPYSTKPYLSAIYCCNSIPRFEDQTDSMERRLWFLPFDKDFSDLAAKGLLQEDKDIKSVYLKDPRVLTWICRRVLDDPSYYPLTDLFPDYGFEDKYIQQYRSNKNTTSSFFSDILDPAGQGLSEKIQSDMVPVSALYTIYTIWCKDSGYNAVSKDTFVQSLERWISTSDTWDYPRTADGEIASAKRVPAPGAASDPRHLEPLLIRYKKLDINAVLSITQPGHGGVDQSMYFAYSATYRGNAIIIRR